jgi:hypothetical protein
MKRLWLAVSCLALTAPVFAEKTFRVPPHVAEGAPTTVTITGNPLTAVIGADTSMQVYNSNVPGAGQFFPPDCLPGQTADYGIFAQIPSGAVEVGEGANPVFGPDFNNHPCGTAANTYTPWTEVSLSPVTGTGTSGDPFTVVVVVDAGLTGLRLTATYTYVNGSPQVTQSFLVSNLGNATVDFDAFSGADLYLADNDEGFAILQGTSAGGRAASSACALLQYTILFLGTTPANNWVGRDYSVVWDEISAGQLSNTIESSLCQDNGAAIQWANIVLPVAGSTTIDSGVTFTGQAIPQGAIVPTLSVTGLAALVLLLALVGYVLLGRGSPGA